MSPSSQEMPIHLRVSVLPPMWDRLFNQERVARVVGLLFFAFHSLNSSKCHPYLRQRLAMLVLNLPHCSVQALCSTEEFLDLGERSPPPMSPTTKGKSGRDCKEPAMPAAGQQPGPTQLSLTGCFPLSPGRRHLSDLALEPPLLHDLLHRDHGKSPATERPSSFIFKVSSCPYTQGGISAGSWGLSWVGGPTAAHVPLFLSPTRW